MKAGKYTIKELFLNKNIDSIIVPEIQRDYVWGRDQVESLLKSLVYDFNKFTSSDNFLNLDIEDETLKKALINHYKSIKYSSSIGFIYAYSDKEFADKYFLIDGQQRLTTIYLTLAVIASLDKEFAEIFKKQFFVNKKSFIEYRVRESSYLFINKAINQIVCDNSYNLKDNYWYYDSYKHDKTIQSIITNLDIIRAYFADENVDTSLFKDYLLDFVQFWYFDTNISEQGEELYVYMNARGEGMQSSENLKADLLAQIETSTLKNKWGEKWESWQDVFWKIRGKNENADNVFNEFIYCVAGIQNMKNELGIEIEHIDQKYTKPSHNQLLKSLETDGLVTIQKYINAFEILFSSEIDEFCIKSNLHYDWLKKLRKIFRQLLNKNYTNWFANVNDKNRGTERNRMVLVWSILDYLTKYSTIDENLLLSIRIFYNRYHNFDRAVLSNIINANEFAKHTYKAIITDNTNNEEVLKYEFIHSKENHIDFTKILSLIWKIEDHPINLDGRDVKNINSSHLIDYTDEITLNHLKNIHEKFFHLFPITVEDNDTIDWKNYNLFLTTLITYGKFWMSKVTNDYDNLDFDKERRIVRDIDSSKECFKRFFKDLINSDSLEDLSVKKITEPVYNVDSEDVEDVVKFYNFHLREKMWNQGWYVAMGNHKHQKVDKYFPNFWRLVNTKGNFQGGQPQVLSRMVKIKVED
ncbi:hypothetical protein A5893_09645 [Pedobacter psychrophilus]|uniref:GmrSD restriction endonucleases N-terminal domain-containing protein n=1 Tax=Pedobacter psychrophilus TaxID=1826909 RepID=A0A179DFK1_9SPHI|nr:DUF262 domain-containing protein [Pedobacter psychrophilus]OAQ39827.1 hypothetical protein A5893_09645 [Pedobacter psychrophilus]